MSLTDYDILRVIGRGSYGEVHLVTHKKDKKQYVIKKMFVNSSAKERKAAEQEAKLLSNLRHPNIVSYKDSFESETGHLYIVMGFAEGGDLYTKLREHKEKKELLSEQQTVRWYIQICMALQYLHDKRILHRDLKTQNIFLTRTKIIKVGDLGIAKVLESGIDMATTLIGTPYYMSPELFANKPYNHKSDVWALGCCMYEMVTLKHAFNAKDINSLMYKILKGKMPPMPAEYPQPLCDLIKDMLNPEPEKRPSVNRILRNPYVKKHIQLFLDESNRKRRPASDRSSRRSAGVVSRQTPSRKTSTNSQGSTPSPHPPSLAPDPAKPARQARARSPNIVTPSPEVQNERCLSPPEKDLHEISKRTEKLDIYEGGDVITVPPVSQRENDRNVPGSPVSRVVTSHTGSHSSSPSVNENTNNSKQESGISNSYNVTPQLEKVEIHPPKESQSDDVLKPVSYRGKQDFISDVSALAVKTQKNKRPLPKCPAVTAEPRKAEDSSSNENLRASGESIDSSVSVSSSVAVNENGAPRVSSARQRRRETKQREKGKAPAILEEIRRSRNTGFKQVISGKKPLTTKKENGNKRKESAPEQVNNEKSAPVAKLYGAVQPPPPVVDRPVVMAEEPQRGQPEVEEFMTMLQTTLHLGSDKGLLASEDGNENPESRKGDLSPVMELSESSSTVATNKSSPYAANTPASTPVSYPVPATKRMATPVTKATLHSTQRLMDRITTLRKDCIKGLGVVVLHRAYEILDANEKDDDILKEQLIGLLGTLKFDQWGGKIWQLKFCEESLFGHCETLTVT